MVRGYLALLAACTFLLGASNGNDLARELKQTAAAYNAHIAAIAPIAGRDTTWDYYERLSDDAQLLEGPVPAGYAQDDWSHFITHSSQLDISLATQLLQRKYQPIASIRGLGETLLLSSKDGTMQPVAVYVPSTYDPSRASPLMVFLHGRLQPETQLLAQPFIEQLAEAHRMILIAPWGRGYYNYRGSREDVYGALDAAEQAFNVDSHKRYLAGYSMGGFAVFEIAPVRPTAWAAVMSISGGLLGSDSSRVVTMMRGTPFYVLTGSEDQSVPTYFPSSSANYLHTMGMDVSFYSQPGGTHRLFSLLPILTLAWNDMLTQIVRAPPVVFSDLQLPSVMPMVILKP